MPCAPRQRASVCTRTRPATTANAVPPTVRGRSTRLAAGGFVLVDTATALSRSSLFLIAPTSEDAVKASRGSAGVQDKKADVRTIACPARFRNALGKRCVQFMLGLPRTRGFGLSWTGP